MRAVIMAGGEGTRLRPFTHTIPKPLLPIGRKPVAQIIIERLRDCGIDEITMSLQYGSDLIRAFFQDGRQFGVRISYYQEPSKLGTAGCLSHIPQLREGPFLVTNGDVLTDLDYGLFANQHSDSDASLTMAVRRDQLLIPYGVVTLNGESVASIEEKPTLDFSFNAGIYALSPDALDLVPAAGAFDMTELIAALIAAKKKVRPHIIEGVWFDLARVGDFEKALEQIEQAMPGVL